MKRFGTRGWFSAADWEYRSLGFYALPAWHEQILARRHEARRLRTLINSFNPTAYDPDTWPVCASRPAGLGHLRPSIMTALHARHRVFDYKITNSRDVLEMLANACAGRGRNWVATAARLASQNYPNLGRHHEMSAPAVRQPDERYLEYVRNQVVELCTRCGDLAVFWDVNVAGFHGRPSTRRCGGAAADGHQRPGARVTTMTRPMKLPDGMSFSSPPRPASHWAARAGYRERRIIIPSDL